jgi:hypothetical protein
LLYEERLFEVPAPARLDAPQHSLC